MEELKNGTLLEFAGLGYGLVIDQTEKTLLIRKCMSSDQEFTPLPEATFVEKSLVESAYWIKKVSNPKLTETLDIIRSVDLVTKFFDM